MFVCVGVVIGVYLAQTYVMDDTTLVVHKLDVYTHVYQFI